MYLRRCVMGMAVTVLAACSSNEVIRGPLDISVGQQLIDLKQAHTSGALTDAEFDQQRKLLISKVR